MVDGLSRRQRRKAVAEAREASRKRLFEEELRKEKAKALRKAAGIEARKKVRKETRRKPDPSILFRLKRAPRGTRALESGLGVLGTVGGVPVNGKKKRRSVTDIL